ncbi:MAG: hypothetical protein EBV45_08035 [Chloroflexi bacterium]|nr:hypothetical protein [Chloroflexota bacterium]
MALRINYNLASSSAQRGLSASQDAYAKQATRLSTGLRINSASDDAAGMAVSEKLKNQVRGLNQAQRNAQDGVSFLQTAEGGLAEIHSSLAALTAIDAAVNTVSTNRANFGAQQSRLESVGRSLAVASENTAAANSRIADADIAASMSELVRAQILQQAGISVLAQANQAPSLVLQLLK